MRKPRILLVDDDERFVTALRTRLQSLDFEVVTATDGYAGLARAAQDKPDVLVLDINMPAGEGLGVQERLGKLPQVGGLPTICLTDDRPGRTDTIARDLGAVAVHRKPFRMEDLLIDIDRALTPLAA